MISVLLCTLALVRPCSAQNEQIQTGNAASWPNPAEKFGFDLYAKLRNASREHFFLSLKPLPGHGHGLGGHGRQFGNTRPPRQCISPLEQALGPSCSTAT